MRYIMARYIYDGAPFNGVLYNGAPKSAVHARPPCELDPALTAAAARGPRRRACPGGGASRCPFASAARRRGTEALLCTAPRPEARRRLRTSSVTEDRLRALLMGKSDWPWGVLNPPPKVLTACASTVDCIAKRRKQNSTAP